MQLMSMPINIPSLLAPPTQFLTPSISPLFLESKFTPITPPTPTAPENLCKICSGESHGLHFGVLTCRACAAFFRRFVVLNLEYECVRDKVKCQVDNIRRSSCRHCRYQKCLRVGMTADNVQWNRDIYRGDLHQRKKQKSPDVKKNQVLNNGDTLSISPVATPPALPVVSLYSEVKLQDKLYTKSILADCNYDSLEKSLHNLFMNEIPSVETGYLSSMNSLEKVTHGLKLIRSTQLTDGIQFQNRLSIDTLVPHWRLQALNTGILSMHSMAFRKIPLTEKSRIFKSLWQNIYRFERIQMSTEIFGEECVSEKKLAISCEKAIQLDSLFLDIEGIASEKLKVTLEDYKTFAERCVEEVAKPLSQLKLSLPEVAWLIVNFVLHNEEKILGESFDVCDDFREEIANNLHEHYAKNNIINYAPRISKMMSIIASMKRIHYDDLAGTFNSQCPKPKIRDSCLC